MKDERVDRYIEKSAEFAQPILEQIRRVVTRAVPEVNETMKWSFPHFEYKKSILCSMASFRQHCSFGFWLGSLMDDPDKIMNPVGETGMGHFGKIASLDDLPSEEILTKYIYQAIKLIDSGAKLEKKAPVQAKELMVPEDLSEALKNNSKAMATFELFSPSGKKEYVDWITEAKTDVTRKKRLDTAIEWMSEGKIRHWKYVRK